MVGWCTKRSEQDYEAITETEKGCKTQGYSGADTQVLPRGGERTSSKPQHELIMKTLQLEDQKARELYKTGSTELKQILLSTWGKDFFSEKITDRIKTWEDVLAEANVKEEDIIPFLHPKNKQQKSLNAIAKIQLLSQVLNEGWKPDFSNYTECKYYVWFEYKNGAWRFFGLFCRNDSASLGAGFYFKTKELAEYAGKQFLNIYQDYLS